MLIFVTGATGFLGSYLVPELLSAGHDVLGLARSDAAANALAAAGARVRRGSLGDLDGLRAGAALSDGVIHLAFNIDFTRYEEECRTDLSAVKAFAAELRGSQRPLAIASGTIGLPAHRVATEADLPDLGHPMSVRFESERSVLAAAETGVRASSVRLPPIVHGTGKQGILEGLIQVARSTGVSAYIGEGSSRWPAVHVADAACLFRLAVEQAPSGSVLHATAEHGVATKQIAEVIGRHLAVPTRSIPGEDAITHFGIVLGSLLISDVPASSMATRKLLPWRPTQLGLIEEIESGHYFSRGVSPQEF